MQRLTGCIPVSEGLNVDKEGIKLQQQISKLELNMIDIKVQFQAIAEDLAKRGILIKIPSNAVSESMGDESL
jgi:hypothetical protein